MAEAAAAGRPYVADAKVKAYLESWAELGITRVATPQKRGPKTDPLAPHNATVRAKAQELIDQGNTIVSGGRIMPERLVKTPGGVKSGRRADIVYSTPSGEVKGVNVGRAKADGVSPVKREQEALDDLNGPGNLPTDFSPYEP
jgi:hypothetical protein